MSCKRKPVFSDYFDKYQQISMRRENGILEVMLHSNGGSMVWGAIIHEELGFCFSDIANDIENEVVIITGAGEAFCNAVDFSSFGTIDVPYWHRVLREGVRMLSNMLEIAVPVIAAVNGPAHIHAELAVLSNIVVASDTASFQDYPHVQLGAVAGDGVHVAWPLLLGPTRASYFLLTGQVIDAAQALEMGVVHEVVPYSDVLPRAWELAEQLLKCPRMSRVYTRTILAQPLKAAMLEHLSHGLALEGLAMLGG
jgi:enoyl-CoA hydratase/carnithine racemase